MGSIQRLCCFSSELYEVVDKKKESVVSVPTVIQIVLTQRNTKDAWCIKYGLHHSCNACRFISYLLIPVYRLICNWLNN